MAGTKPKKPSKAQQKAETGREPMASVITHYKTYRCKCGKEGQDPVFIHTAGGVMCHYCGSWVEAI